MTTQSVLKSDAVIKAAQNFVNFINKAPSPFHVVDEIKQILNKAGFVELQENSKWDIKPNDKCYVTKNLSTIVAFTVGGAYLPGNGFTMIGTHTDSPCLKVKPYSKTNKLDYLQVGVECYGGGIWATWFDRDLSVAGRVVVKEGDQLVQHLVRIERPILKIPNLAIHLQRDINEKFVFNKETHLYPIIGTTVADTLNASGDTPGTKKSGIHHQPLLMKVLSEKLGKKAEKIVDLELCLADCQPACIGGIENEFIFSPRLDNLLSTVSAVNGLVAASTDLAKEPNIRLIGCFDNEEVGSESSQGASSNFLEWVLRRLSYSSTHPLSFEEAIPKSMLLSSDCSHAIHPNYPEKHEANHQPSLHGGIVIKQNVNQRYATTSVTRSVIRTIAEKAQVPLQDFVVRNDSACGTTIGPIIAAKLGLATVDIGAAQLSMHSIREMCGTTSVYYNDKLFEEFFLNFPAVWANVK